MKSVVIVGLAPSSRALCLSEPSGVEMWTLNDAHDKLPGEAVDRMTRWFQIHPWAGVVKRRKRSHLEFLQNARIPVYLHDWRPDEVPMGIRYPYEEVVDDLGMEYFTSSVAYMLALAMYERFDDVSLYGVDMATHSEYMHQRPCVEYLLGVASGRGMQIRLPESCPLLSGPLYGR